MTECKPVFAGNAGHTYFIEGSNDSGKELTLAILWWTSVANMTRVVMLCAIGFISWVSCHRRRIMCTLSIANKDAATISAAEIKPDSARASAKWQLAGYHK